MIPAVYTLLKANNQLLAILGPDPLRIFPWAEATQGTRVPYVTYTVFNGNPQNLMDKVPDIDNLGTQIDVWALTAASCEAIAILVRDTLEPHAHMTSVADMEKDKETKLYRLRMDFDFFTNR